ncbi:MAG: glycosyltransferase [Lachnospiraceae bacterium]|nr:glycosyltransferase [Lachnospiraceae bacterium]
MVDISVIIPFYNGNCYIDRIVSMVNNNVEQLGTDIVVELLIVNDSPWVRVKEPKDSLNYTLRILNYKNNVGIQGARIRGLQEAQGNYVLMLDQDDEISDMFLLDTYSNIKEHDVCVANGELIRPKGNKPIYLSEKKQKLVSNLFLYAYLENRILSPGHCLIKKESIPIEWTNNPLTINGADDLALWILMLCQRRKFTYVTNKLYKHIDTGENVSSDEMNMAKSTYEACEFLSNISYVPRWVTMVMKRKIDNDVFYVQNGKDKYIDYILIEKTRKLLNRARN